MEKTKNRKIAISLILTLILPVFAVLATAPAANAAVVQIDTYAYIMLSPDPVGIGQQVLVSYRIDKVRMGATDTANHFEGFSVSITKPDGTAETRSNLDVDSTSGGWFLFAPTMTGTYKFQTHFPAQWANGTGAGGVPYTYYYKASDSSIVDLTVQADPIQGIPNNPLPDGYWTRPINAENKGWNTIADNWLMRAYDHPNRGFCMTTAVAPYTSAPNSAHILWAKPIIFGGQGGGQFGDKSYYTGLSYEQFYTPLILEGRIIYTEHGPTGTAAFGTRILDLYTGEEIMFLDNIDIPFAQVLDINNPNEHGLIAYLWSTSGPSSNSTWTMYDAFTGRKILTVVNVTWGGLGGFNGGPTAFGPNGEILSYSFAGSGEGRRLICWNSTKAISSRVGIDVWSPTYNGVMDGSRGIQYNVSVPFIPGLGISVIGEGYILAQVRDASQFPYVLTDVCYKQATGEQLWVKNRTEIYTAFFAQPQSIHDGMYIQRDEGKMVTYAYSIQTGNQLWVTDPLPSGWGIFEYQRDIAYGKVYTTGYTGSVRAYDAANGELAWQYDQGSAGYETVYGTWPTYNGFTIADHKIFVSNDEHSPDSVLWRGGKLMAINTDTGNLVWNISGMMRNPAIADGILTALNSYDGQVYTFGKGPSATTVSSPDIGVSLGTGVMIKGTVTDQSPGQKGTPAIADESMTAWMEYLYMQKPIPGDAKGVQVKLSAVGPDGSTVDIGTATSDMSGNFGFAWTPTAEGTYQIMATFEGTESYSSSYAMTYLLVGPAQASGTQPTPSTPTTTAPTTVTPTTTSTVSPSVVPPTSPLTAETLLIIGAAVVIIAVVAAAAVLLRKRQ